MFGRNRVESFRMPAGRSHIVFHSLRTCLALSLIVLLASCAEQGANEKDAGTGKTDAAAGAEAGKKAAATPGAGESQKNAGESEKTEAEMPQGNTEPEPAPESAGQTADAAPQPGQVLRHAVFFKFKESSTPEEINEVVQAFRKLPDQIESIQDFEWGTNNSPEGLDDGFTHAFLLTFQDAEGRAEYLPHPAHKAFGDVLRPHMEDVFVIDYWGDADGTDLDRPLRHAVFFKFTDDAAPEDIEKIEKAFAELPGKIEAIKAFEWGTNNSPESHDDGFTHAFLVTFASEDDRESYLPHPEHQAFVEVLKPILDKVRVVDFWAEN